MNPHHLSHVMALTVDVAKMQTTAHDSSNLILKEAS